MARFLRGFIFRIFFAAVCALASAWVQTPIALAQHGGGGGGGHMGGGGGHMGGGGGHMGGGGGHMGGGGGHVGGGGGHVGGGGGHVGGGGGHVGGGHFSGAGHGVSPRGFVPRTGTTTIRRPRGSPPPTGAGVRNPRFQQHPPHVVHRHVFFGRPFHRFRHGFNSFWWPNWCPYSWGWGFNCYTWPSLWYGYGFGSDPPYYNPGAQSVPSYGNPPYHYDEDWRDLTELYLKDGTAYEVTDYWLEDGKIHFRTPDGYVEHVLDVEELDLQTTVDVNTRRGLRFVLRNEPLE